jgi:hypothetical protein
MTSNSCEDGKNPSRSYNVSNRGKKCPLERLLCGRKLLPDDATRCIIGPCGVQVSALRADPIRRYGVAGTLL